MNIVQLNGPRSNITQPAATPNQSCVELIQEIMKKAEAGEITFAIIVATTPDGAVVDGWSSNDRIQPYTVLGALSAVAHRFDDENIHR